MAENKFINPLFRRTDLAGREPELPPPSPSEPRHGAAGEGTPRPAARRRAGPAGRRKPQEATSLLEPSVKFTFYFSPAQLRRLDDLWARAKLDHQERLNKSEFVRLALDRLLAEFEKNPRRVLEDLRRQRP